MRSTPRLGDASGHTSPGTTRLPPDRATASPARCVMSADVGDLPSSVFDGQPERLLMLAVLLDAVGIVRRPSNGRRRLFDEARDWLLSDDMLWPFSFVNICDTLDLDPGRLRTLVASALDEPGLARGSRIGTPCHNEQSARKETGVATSLAHLIEYDDRRAGTPLVAHGRVIEPPCAQRPGHIGSDGAGGW